MVALSSLPFAIGRVAGPALGAVLMTWAHPSFSFGVAAMSGVAFVVIVRAVVPATPADGRGGARRGALEGLRYLREEPAVAAMIVAIMAIGIGADPAITLTPAIVAGLGAAPGLVGGLASAFGIGSATGFLLLGRLRRRFRIERLAMAGMVLLGAGLVALAVSTTPVLAMLAIGVAGVGMATGLSAFTTMVQQRVPDALRGRVMALWSVAFLGSRPIAALMNGQIADELSVEAAIGAVVLVVVVGAIIARPGRVRPTVRS